MARGLKLTCRKLDTMKPATMPERKEKPRSCSARSSCSQTASQEPFVSSPAPHAVQTSTVSSLNGPKSCSVLLLSITARVKCEHCCILSVDITAVACRDQSFSSFAWPTQSQAAAADTASSAHTTASF